MRGATANSKAALIEEGCLYSRIYNKLKNKKALRQCYIFKLNILLINIYGRGSLMQEGPFKYSKTFHTSQIYFHKWLHRYESSDKNSAFYNSAMFFSCYITWHMLNYYPAKQLRWQTICQLCKSYPPQRIRKRICNSIFNILKIALLSNNSR